MNKKEISPSSARISHKITSWKIKMPSLPLRGARTEHTNSAVPPCLPENSDRSAERQHALCPLTLALRQKILRGSPLFSLPSAAHLLPRSSPRSQPPGLSVDALAALLPLRWFQFMLRPLYIICVRLSRTFFQELFLLFKKSVLAVKCELLYVIT